MRLTSVKDVCCTEQPSSCCSQGYCCETEMKPKTIPTSTHLTFNDIIGGWKVRWGIGRMSYLIEPGIYFIGDPDSTAPVLVSTNYKLTFDSVRKELDKIDCWLLILDTKGVNVWCAAGKGTFGTNELVNRIKKSGLAKLVSHRRLILPQLGASGISAHEVKRQSGFTVEYGPIRASDIRKYLENDHKADEKMRTVQFTFKDRLVLTPIELTNAMKQSLMIFGILFILNLFSNRLFGIKDFVIYSGTIFTGTILTPILLPFIPGKAFSWKGWLLGFIWVMLAFWKFDWFIASNWMIVCGYLFLLPSVSAYLAMNFTGSSTYTSFSGVTKEMKTAIPMILISGGIGTVLLIVKSLIG